MNQSNNNPQGAGSTVPALAEDAFLTSWGGIRTPQTPPFPVGLRPPCWGDFAPQNSPFPVGLRPPRITILNLYIGFPIYKLRIVILGGRRPTGNGGVGGAKPPQQGGRRPTGNGGSGGGRIPPQEVRNASFANPGTVFISPTAAFEGMKGG